jgi:hypothetical protein
MARSTGLLLGTHASPTAPEPLGLWVCFDLDECDSCGCDIQAANPFSVSASKRQLLDLGVTIREFLPPEGMLQDGPMQTVVCPSCYDPAKDAEWWS